MTGSRSSTGMASRRAARGAAFLLGVSMALSLGAGAALADKVGVAAAVNQFGRLFQPLQHAEQAAEYRQVDLL